MWRQAFAILCVGIFLYLVMFLIGYREGYNYAKHKFCVHGESSIMATKINGHWVQSKPVRTGC